MKKIAASFLAASLLLAGVRAWINQAKVDGCHITRYGSIQTLNRGLVSDCGTGYETFGDPGEFDDTE